MCFKRPSGPPHFDLVPNHVILSTIRLARIFKLIELMRCKGQCRILRSFPLCALPHVNFSLPSSPCCCEFSCSLFSSSISTECIHHFGCLLVLLKPLDPNIVIQHPILLQGLLNHM